MWCYGLWQHPVFYVDINVLDQHAASILRVDTDDAGNCHGGSLSTYHTTRCHSTQVHILNTDHCENLKFYIRNRLALTPNSSAMSWHEHHTENITSLWGISIISLYTFDTRTCSVNQKSLSSLALNCHNMWQWMFYNILVLWLTKVDMTDHKMAAFYVETREQ